MTERQHPHEGQERFLSPDEAIDVVIDDHITAIHYLNEVKGIFTDERSGEFDNNGFLTSLRITQQAFQNDTKINELYDQLADAMLLWQENEKGMQRLNTFMNCYLDNKERWDNYLERYDKQIEK